MIFTHRRQTERDDEPRKGSTADRHRAGTRELGGEPCEGATADRRRAGTAATCRIGVEQAETTETDTTDTATKDTERAGPGGHSGRL